jgi:hypothetical protein
VEAFMALAACQAVVAAGWSDEDIIPDFTWCRCRPEILEKLFLRNKTSVLSLLLNYNLNIVDLILHHQKRKNPFPHHATNFKKVAYYDTAILCKEIVLS